MLKYNILYITNYIIYIIDMSCLPIQQQTNISHQYEN